MDEGSTVIEPVSTSEGVEEWYAKFRVSVLGRTLDLDIMRARKGVVLDFRWGFWHKRVGDPQCIAPFGSLIVPSAPV